MTTPTTYHEGRPILRDIKGGVLVLCPFGHVYTFQVSRDWAGSWLEAMAGDSTWAIRCTGTLPQEG